VANHKSALKRHRQSLRRRTANRVVRSRVGSVVRRLREAIAAGDSDTAKRELVAAESILGKAAGKGVLHRSTASRQTSRLAQQVAKLSSN
jgi:small subunit ribosomal protein S20